ncbi:MAG: 4Fe-4S dicluster domain-containing protein [Saprospiraceae bacterium]|nr:polysulfide reductase NrfD [Saprospiraceae bacterium]MCB9314385.1 polysulfide reductase NrfD [Lewinellaceae bacterium]
MKYGFIIDNRKCIGCHACTTACKSEHDVPVGVNRTWVKQVEKGEFPHTRRLFSVMRCNHCTDAPCVDICPVEALYIREDGIVDFDKERCIACKSCMQACPYDALYIDPETHTAAKCNYCAHRVDIGLEPACVNVCPEHAIISGDMDNPESEIAILLGTQQVKVRKPEKGTVPNLFYIDADDASLNPSLTTRPQDTLWGRQEGGVGHFAKAAEKMAFSNPDVVSALMEVNGQSTTADEVTANGKARSVDLLIGKTPRRVYDTPNKGILWGWEVSGYVWTKAIATGAILVPFVAWLMGAMGPNLEGQYWSLGLGIFFLAATGALLVKDLDQPTRFVYVLLRPQWKSWLPRGGYAITVFGGLMALSLVLLYLGQTMALVQWLTAAFAVLVAVYTAFLFAQAKGRDFWQSPTLALHMLVHSLMAGGSAFALVNLITGAEAGWTQFLNTFLMVSLGANLAILVSELATPHPTHDTHRVVDMIVRGVYRNRFWLGTVLIGNLIPLALLFVSGGSPVMMAAAALMILAGIYITEHIWVEAPQRISLS